MASAKPASRAQRPCAWQHMPLVGSGAALLLLLLCSSCQNQYLQGRYSLAAFRAAADWRHTVAPRYRLRGAWADSLRQLPPDTLALSIYLGTWCSDSKRWVPRMLRVVEDGSAGLQLSSLEIIALDTSKRDAEGRAAAAGIDSLPTFCFMRDTRELARFHTRPWRGRLAWQLYRIRQAALLPAHGTAQ